MIKQARYRDYWWVNDKEEEHACRYWGKALSTTICIGNKACIVAIQDVMSKEKLTSKKSNVSDL